MYRESETGNDRSNGQSESARRRTFLKLTGGLVAYNALGGEVAGALTDAQEAMLENAESDVRKFTVHAVEVDIVFNKFGLHQPNGAMYVLEENLNAVKQLSGQPLDGEFEAVDGDGTTIADTSLIEPLVIRANQGQTVEIEFHNDLNRPTSMHTLGLPQDPKDSDGMNVGKNPDTTVQPGESTTYRWLAAHQGGHMFWDGANQGYKSPKAEPEKANLVSRGLFGALVVEPPGATWTDPETGQPLASGTKADIHDPEFTGTSYREFVPFYHTPSGVYVGDGNQLKYPHSGADQTVHAINYRAEPTGSRADEGNAPDDLITLFYSSWPNGDPGAGDNVFHAYKGDPIKFVAMGASLEENHVHHVHNSRWKTVPKRTDSDTIDAQTLGFGTGYTQYLIAGHGTSQGTQVHDPEETVRPGMNWTSAFTNGGAGYYHGGAGDILFHCHLFPHYVEGMWSFMRVHDKERPGLEPLPNTNIVQDFLTSELPLSDGILPADSAIPGYPDYVPGTVGEFPPLPVSTDRKRVTRQKDFPVSHGGTTDIPDLPNLTTKEKKAGLSTDIPGAPYQDPVPDDVSNPPVREHTVYCVQGKDIGDTVYNDAGDYDPEALVYVHEDDFQAVMNGDMNVEPLFIRANVGEVINITIKNRTAYPLSIHPHFVAFDPQGTDSTPSIGLNYWQGILPDEERTFRWFADEEGPIYFHDHVVGGEKIMHGTFAGLIVEPEGSRHLDPYSGEPISSGAQAIIEVPDGTDFREFALHYSDYSPLRDPDTGELIRQQEEHNVNIGTTSINNRNAPYYHRDDEDPAYVHSSAVHGDPATPLLEAYSNDPIRIRLFQGAFEEQHNFTIHGRQVEPEGLQESDTVSQVISPSEAFTWMIDPQDAAGKPQFERQPNPAGLPVQDYMYGSDIVDDRFTGMWGIHRVFDAEVPHLEPLPDRSPPSGEITATELKEMGHSAPFLGINRLKTLGQRARLIWEDGANRERPPDWAARTQNPNVGHIPPKPPDPGDPCPDGVRVRKYQVEALHKDLVFNDYGDHDPHGIVFALKQHAAGIKAGTREPEPLTIRANRTDCIEVTLTNDLPQNGIDDNHPDPPMRIPREWKSSERVSLHPQRITYDVTASDGATVGFNYDQTVGPGESITYRWYADDLYDNMVLTDMADVRGHRHHGAFGNLIIEPEDATWLDPRTAEPHPNGVGAMINRKNRSDQREYSLAISDGRYIVNRDDPDFCIVEGYDHDGQTPCTQIGTFEDSGFGSINYSSEPFAHRFQTDSSQYKVYDSTVHGDPATPILRAQLGDEVKFLVHQTADKARGVSFHVSGHQWQRYRDVPESPVTGTDDRFSPSKGMRLGLTSPAGGHQKATGDYIYQETKQRRRLESGMWGIFRVQNNFKDFEDDVQPLPERVDKQVLPEDRPGWNVARGDLTPRGDEDVIIGVPGSSVGADGGGAVYVFESPSSQITDLASADAAFYGSTPGEGAGTNVKLTRKGSKSSAAVFLVIETANGSTYELPGGKVLAAELRNPSATPGKAFLNNTTANSIKVVHEIAEVQNNGYQSHSEGNFVVEEMSFSGDIVTETSLLECSDCGQHSAVTGEGSRWEKITEVVEEATAIFECEECGSEVTVRY